MVVMMMMMMMTTTMLIVKLKVKVASAVANVRDALERDGGYD